MMEKMEARRMPERFIGRMRKNYTLDKYEESR